MISDAVLSRAVADGLITSGQALALQSLAREVEPELAGGRPRVREAERLRFVSGFADIFVTLGLVLFLGSAAYLAGRSVGDGPTAALLAVLSWGLAEFFSRRHRMALPSIVLLVVFALASFAALAALFGTGRPGPRLGWLGAFVSLSGRDPLGAATAALGTAALAGLHYWRFRVPITVAAGVGALTLAALLAAWAAAPIFVERHINALLLAAGLISFATAMRFDLSDPRRVTRRTDIAFWLHLLAAPLIVHSVFEAVGAGRGTIPTSSALTVLAIFSGLALVAVLVDRRALLVSGLVYAGVAFGSLISRAGLVDLTVPYTLLGLGAFVLALSAGWGPLRRAVLALAPASLAAKLPRPVTA